MRCKTGEKREQWTFTYSRSREYEEQYEHRLELVIEWDEYADEAFDHPFVGRKTTLGTQFSFKSVKEIG